MRANCVGRWSSVPISFIEMFVLNKMVVIIIIINTVLEGRCPSDIATIFLGGRLTRLIALTKKSGGLRPIVVGLTLRRLASKCASVFGIAQSSSYLVLCSSVLASRVEWKQWCTLLDDSSKHYHKAML